MRVVSVGVAILSVLCGFVEGLSYFRRQTELECGSSVVAPGTYKITSGKTCAVQLLVPTNQALKMFVYGDEIGFDCNLLRNSIKIRERSGKTYSMCSGDGVMTDFVGYNSEYTLLFNDVPFDVVIGIKFVPTTMECGQVVNMDFMNVDITFVNNRATSCAIFLPPGVILTVHAGQEESKCGALYELGLGTHISRMSRSTGTQCVGAVPQTFPVFCPAALLWNLQPGSSIKMTLRPANQKEREAMEPITVLCNQEPVE